MQAMHLAAEAVKREKVRFDPFNALIIVTLKDNNTQ